jgi:hypothetical protein
MQCPQCGSPEKYKAGFIGEKQRYQCKNFPCIDKYGELLK